MRGHLIVSHEVTTVGNDRRQLANMRKQAKAAPQKEALTVVADGITPIMPRCLTSGNKANGLFDRHHFVYDPRNNTYQCPAGEVLIEGSRSLEGSKNLIIYCSSN